MIFLTIKFLAMNRSKLRQRRPKINVDYYGLNRSMQPRHGVRNFLTQKYWNEIIQREVCNKPAPLLLSSDVTINDFKYYDLLKIKSDFKALWEKVALFLTLLYDEELTKSYNLNDWPYLYWDHKKLRAVLGKDYLGVIEKLEYHNIISTMEKRSFLNPIRRSNYFMLNISFIQLDNPISQKKTLINPVYERTILNYFKKLNQSQSELEQYITSALAETRIEISNTKKISLVSQLLNDKKSNDLLKSANPFESNSKLAKLKRNLVDPNYYCDYERLLSITIDRLNKDLNQRNSVTNIVTGVRKSLYGDRISHMYSNVPKELRKKLRIQGEIVAEVDIVTSQPNFLLYIIDKWFYRSDFGAINNIFYPETFIKAYRSDHIELDGMDFYEKMTYYFKTNLGDLNISRDQMKSLFMRVVFGNLDYEAVSGFNREGLITCLFGVDFYKFLESVNKIEVHGIDKSESHKNLSALLQREESMFLEDVMNELKVKGVIFLPLYDSLIIKQSDLATVKMAFKATIIKNDLEEFIHLK